MEGVEWRTYVFGTDTERLNVAFLFWTLKNTSPCCEKRPSRGSTAPSVGDSSRAAMSVLFGCSSTVSMLRSPQQQYSESCTLWRQRSREAEKHAVHAPFRRSRHNAMWCVHVITQCACTAVGVGGCANSGSAWACLPARARARVCVCVCHCVCARARVCVAFTHRSQGNNSWSG